MSQDLEELPEKEQKILVWAMLGPFCMLGAVAIMLVKARTELYYHMPLIMMVGLLGCWRYRYRALALALTILLATTTYELATSPDQELFWVLGLAISVALSLIVATLAFDETDASVAELRRESNSRLQNLWNIDEKLKLAQQHWQAEREGLKGQVSKLSREAEDAVSQLESWRRAVALVRQELDDTESSQERLLEELYTLRISSAQPRVIQEQAPQEQAPSKVEVKQLISALNQARCDRYQLKLDLAHLTCTPRPDNTSGQNVALWRRLRQSQAMYRQLRDQFEAKDAELAKARKALHDAEELSLRAERSQVDAEMVPLAEVQAMLQQQIDHYESEEIASLEQIITELTQERAAHHALANAPRASESPLPLL